MAITYGKSDLQLARECLPVIIQRQQAMQKAVEKLDISTAGGANRALDYVHDLETTLHNLKRALEAIGMHSA